MFPHILVSVVIFVAFSMVLAYQRASLSVWSIAFFIFLMGMVFILHLSVKVSAIFFSFYLLIFTVLNIPSLRRFLVSNAILKIYRSLIPRLSETESVALESGTVGWEAELFNGMPDWEQFRKTSLSILSDEERVFIEGPVEELCKTVDDWKIARDMEIPETIWIFLKSNGFFGMTIPKKYGGKEFSPLGHAQVILKLASVSTAVATVASVPNSLGPAELLLRYGTPKQKKHYLPRLASGLEIPCFALTSLVAGSDANAITDTGIICRDVFDGKECLCLRLNWDKRYITLSPVATLIGLAFKCYDPEQLLSDKVNLGITCALVSVNLQGVTTGRIHFPLHCAFPNGPTQGRDVLIPLDCIIGGEKMIGQGWRMLMECLATGRSISLPSMVVANAKRILLASGAYARIRRQFNTPIAKFEGVQAVLARMTGYTYAVEALRALTLTYLNNGEMPALASAISKYYSTEMSRMIVNDAMDIHAGKGICMGPKNYLAQCYIESPISITVEGSNILTRSLMIYGQGVVRCHPYLLTEMKAAIDKDNQNSNIVFDRALFSHIGFMISNKVRSFCLAIRHAREGCSRVPLKPYYQLLARFSASLAFLSDVMIILVGKKLKRREMLSARLGDILSLLYIISSILKFYEHKNEPSELPLLAWVCRELFYRIQSTFDALIVNIDNKIIRFWLRFLIFPRGKQCKPPSDHLSCEVANLITAPSLVRMRFSENIYYTKNSNNPIANMESILTNLVARAPIEIKISNALKEGMISGDNIKDLVRATLEKNIISKEERDFFLKVEEECMEAISVDDFFKEAL